MADRDALILELYQAGISCTQYFVPIHTQKYIMDLLGTKEGDFPVTEHLADRTIALPFSSNLTRQQVSRVADSMAEALKTIKAG